MKHKWYISILSVLLSVSFLSACNLGNNEMNEQDGVGTRPVRYDRDNNNGVLDNNRDLDPTDVRFDRDNDLDINNNEGADLDTDPRNIRRQGEPDTPFNMDEEEPDLDEEPSEERRGF
ncbi:hypothetical protein [Bacillus sp. J33]|uniref:hypothetical protein n=1 Tax=Bacillus sp. J33 TaxID=935836 RepID=UPI00047C04E6|nr:hypothetical protein [Bacillus sp. J33]